jgi:hypothetical protein
MPSAKVMPVLFWAMFLAFALLALPQLVWGDRTFYTETLTSHRQLLFAAPAKLLMLCLASYFAFRSAGQLGRDNPASTPWAVLGAGAALFACGQAGLAWYQVILDQKAPFPSAADPLFVVGTVLLITATAMFVWVYQHSGLAMATRGEIIQTLVAGAMPVALIVGVVLRPIAAAEASFWEQFLNLAYPALDLVLFVPAALLLRVMLKLRGGRLWHVWARLLAAVFFMGSGDVLYAYFTTLDFSALDPLLDLTFAYGYILLAWGTFTQAELLRV